MEAKHEYIIESARWRASLHGYEPVSTPIFEYADVFARTLGESSDIVSKEMFTFKDRHDDLLVLRPEGTAGIMRSVLTNKLINQLPLRYFYAGPIMSALKKAANGSSIKSVSSILGRVPQG